MDMVAESVERESEGPWELPEGWEWTTIDAVLDDLGDGRTLHHGWSPQCETWPSTSDEVWAALKTTAIQPGRFLPHENKALPTALSPRPQIEVRAGDLLLTCAGPRSRCGVACLVRETRPRLMFSGKMYRLRPDPSVMDAAFLEAVLQTSFSWRAIDAMKTGGSDSGLNLTHERFRTLLVPLAPLAEQRRIVARVDALFAEIADGEAALEAARKGLDTFRRALLKAAVTGELTKDWRENNPVTETGHDLLARIKADRAAKGQVKGRGKRAADAKPLDAAALPQLPENWAWGMLGEICELITDGDHNPPKRVPNGIPHITAKNVKGGRVTLEGCSFVTEEGYTQTSARYKPRLGDIFITCVGTVGEVAIFYLKQKISIDRNIAAIRLVEQFEPSFIALCLIAPHTAQSLRTISGSTAQPHLYLKDIRATAIPIPPPAEAAEILRRVSEALAASADTRAMLDAEAADAARLKQSILKSAFEGRLVPQDHADEPASAILARLKATPSTAGPARRGRGRRQ
jgi:type I restriction enzyme S subunit